MNLAPFFARWTCVAALAFALPMSAATLTVTNTNDSGPGSLRHMLLSAQAGDRIEFAIGSGPQTILPLSELPAVSHAITIDGSTQPGYAGAPLIELDGSLVGGTVFDVEGLTVNGDVRALVINNFVGKGLRIAYGTVRGCYIGTDRTGTVPKRNGVGIYVSYFSNGNVLTIGGTEPGDGNVISGNGLYGVETATSTTVYIQGNTFGADPGQNMKVGSTSYHVFLSYGDNKAFVGSGTGNVFVGAESAAIESFYEDGKVIENNFIGVTPAGKIIPNYTGISVYQSTGTYIAGNTIKGNTVGVRVSGSSLRNQIIVNSFAQNNLGIDLDTAGYGSGVPTANDSFDGDTGPNNLINFPVLTKAAVAAGTTTLTGTLSTHPNRTHRIEIYSSPACNASGHGEGAQIVDVFDLTSDGSGNAAFTRTLPALAQGSVLTATTTSDLEGTSEFSRCVTVEGPGTFLFASSSHYRWESFGTVAIDVLRVNGAVGAASVSYAVTGGTATPGVDFTGGSGTLNFADGVTSQTIHIPIVDDAVYEGSSDETIQIQLSNPTNGTTVGSPDTTTITIDDNDSPPALAIQSLRVKEGDSGSSVVQVRFSLSAPAPVTMNFPYWVYWYSATQNVDAIAPSGTVTFQPGEIEKFVPVTIIGDTLWENDEEFELYTYGTWGYVTIVNDDPPPALTVDELTVTEADTNTTVNLTLRLPSPMYGAVLVRVLSGSAQAGSDFVPIGGSYVYFDYTGVRTVPITIIGDNLTESDEYIRVQIVRSYGSFTVGTNGTLETTIAILNDDAGVGPAGRSIAAGATGSFTIDLGSARSQPSTVALSTDAPDAISIPSTVVIPAGVPSATFEVRALVADRIANVRVTLPAALGGTIHDLSVSTYSRANLRFSPATVTLIEGQPKTITVSADVPHALTIGLNPTGPIEIPSSLQIPAGGSATFTITPLRPGSFTIDAELPREHGSEVQSMFGEVITAPVVPTLLSLTPSHGPTAGGTEVTVNGANLRASCTLRFGGVPAASSQFVSATKMTAITPPHAGGSVDVTLNCGLDTFTLRHGFGYVSEPPTLANVQPSSGSTGGGTLVRVSGANLDSSCWVFLGNAAATNVVVRDTETITAATPYSATPRTVDVSVRCSGGTFALHQAFTYRSGNDDAPLITSIDPAAAAPGERVTVKGLNFRPDQSVQFATTAATILDAFPDALIVRVPELPAGRVAIDVTDLLGRRTTSGPVFSVLEARPPRITAATPSSVPPGGEVTLDGEGFRPGYTFHIGGRPATIVTLDYTRAVVRVRGDATPGTSPVEVHNSTGALAVLGPKVTVESEGMTLTSVDPRCGTTTGGIVATIRGRGLTDALLVTFDDVPASDVSLIDAMTLSVRVPAGSAGAARVSVSDGTHTATLTNGFTYESPFAPTACAGRTRSVRH